MVNSKPQKSRFPAFDRYLVVVVVVVVVDVVVVDVVAVVVV